MDAATVAAIAAIASVAISLVNLFWKLPDTERRLSKEIKDADTRLTDKFNTLNGEVQHIKGLLEGLGLSGKLPNPPKEG